jgi:beta-mannosidase
MKQIHDLSSLTWTLEGYTPFVWLFERSYNALGDGDPCIDVCSILAKVPGSVQGALRAAGLLPDWNVGVNYRQCEWVEHRHWMYRTSLPDEWLGSGRHYRLECLGLDYAGWVYINRRLVGEFKGTHVPHSFDLTPFLQPSANVLEIVFDLSPRWLGQFGYSSKMTEWKPRFNYTWDWSPRLVQVGIWDDIFLVALDDAEIQAFAIATDYDLEHGTGWLAITASITPGPSGSWQIQLKDEKTVLFDETYSGTQLQEEIQNRQVRPWWPNLEGDQPLYTLTCRFINTQGQEVDRREQRIGFKHVEWRRCEGAPAGADPWLCVINGREIFLQGVNFAPLSANFADLRWEDYARRLKQYQELGLNLFRINACQFLEKEWFYECCDEFGMMVWQEFPLTSSGLENWPPEDAVSIESVAEIARSFITRRRHHVSLLLWSGGNELQGDLEGQKTGIGKPCDASHPMLKRLQEVTHELDPWHRYIPTSPLGPRAGASPEDFGKSLHWDVHGGAAMLGSFEEAEKYWAADDALMRSEIYCPGASPVETIRKYAGEFQTFPATIDNPYWTRLTTWWLDWKRLVAAYRREPDDLEEYVAWSQAEQARRLAAEMQSCKKRFPRCGGVLLWSGHDTFPLAINSSLIDFDGNLKPSATAVSRVWRELPRKRE